MPNINIEVTEEELNKLKKIKPEGYSWKRYLQSSGWIMARLCSEPRNEWGENWKFDPPVTFEKPCHYCGYCPYGQVVEMFPFSDDYSCTVFGHDCPAFYLSEPFSEEMWEDAIKSSKES